ncbi:Z-ring formation inhibitor MciZ [Paenibacillus plantarum]|nr:Z-ring formation inhibitor MciZ [Paenibacillus plantarum]
MKSYVSAKQIRLVGKAWEIKYQLQQMLQQGDPKIPLVDYLAGMYISQKTSSQGPSHKLRIIHA